MSDSEPDGDGASTNGGSNAGSMFQCTVKYNAYETMTGGEGARGEKQTEYRSYKKYWSTRLDPLVDLPPEYVQLWAGGSCAGIYSNTRWKCEGIELLDLRNHQEPKLNYEEL